MKTQKRMKRRSKGFSWTRRWRLGNCSNKRRKKMRRRRAQSKRINILIRRQRRLSLINRTSITIIGFGRQSGKTARRRLKHGKSKSKRPERKKSILIKEKELIWTKAMSVWANQRRSPIKMRRKAWAAIGSRTKSLRRWASPQSNQRPQVNWMNPIPATAPTWCESCSRNWS